ncbi:MAG: hypothetical protein EOM18_04315 [Clostridia bacterium]|nr:hypothetical protein [Clostridia bacterium]
MKEELIRIENGNTERSSHHLSIDMEISRGECIGIFSDSRINNNLLLSFFRGELPLSEGKGYVEGERTELALMPGKIADRTMVLEKHRGFSPELSAWDYLVALRKGMKRRDKKEQLKSFHSPRAVEMRRDLEIDFQWKDSLTSLSPLSFCKLFLFKTWFYKYDILVLGHITEMLREDDLAKLMEYIGHLLQRGMALLVLDQESEFMFSCCTRIDIMKNSITCYRLFPEQYEESVIASILQGDEEKVRAFGVKIPVNESWEEKNSQTVLEFENVKIGENGEVSFQIERGEIGLLLDKNYSTANEIQNLFLNNARWASGTIKVNGKQCAPGKLSELVGKEVGIQMEAPDKRDKTLFYNLTGQENLSCMLIPKTGSMLVRKKMEKSILREASSWFEEADLKKKVSEWTPQERLRLSYYKWFLVNPRVLICFFPFAGTDFWMHHIIMEMLTVCADKGMGILIVSTDIESVCEKVNDMKFINKLRRLD